MARGGNLHTAWVMAAYRSTDPPGWVRKTHWPSNWTRYSDLYQKATQEPTDLAEFTERFDAVHARLRTDVAARGWMEPLNKNLKLTRDVTSRKRLIGPKWLTWFQLDMSQYPSQLAEIAVLLLAGVLWVASLPIRLVTHNIILAGVCVGAAIMALIYRDPRIRRPTKRSDWALHNIALAATAAGCDRVELPDVFFRFADHSQMYTRVAPDHAITFGAAYREGQNQTQGEGGGNANS